MEKKEGCKICHFDAYFPTKNQKGKGGGIENYIFNFVKFLAKKNVISWIYTSRLPRTFPAMETFNSIFIRRFKVNFMLFNYPISLPAFFNTFVQEKFDLIHVHVVDPYWLELGFIVSRLQHIPLVVTYHADPIFFFEGKKSKVHYIFVKILEKIYQLILTRIILPRADLVLFDSHKYLLQSRSMERIHLKPERTKVIHCTIDLEEINSIKKNILPREKTDEIRILFVGRLVQYKGLHVLIKAIEILKEKLKNVKVVIVGDGPEKENLKSQVKLLSLGNLVSFLGRVSKKTLYQEYANCDIFVLPSVNRNEAFGIVQLEAMAFGKPVIASDIGGVSEVCKNNHVGYLVKPGDVMDLAEKIRTLVENPVIREYFSKNALSWVKKEFALENIGPEMYNVYKKILNKQ